MMSLEEDLQTILMEDANIATDKPIAFKSTAEDIALVNGFIRIIQFILRTYLRILFVDNYTNTDNRILQWAFSHSQPNTTWINTRSVYIMMSCTHANSRSITAYFISNALLEAGWGTYKDVTAVWCALHELPEHVSRISVHFQCKCDAIGYDEEETEILTTKTSSKNSSSWLHGKTWSMLPNKLVNDTEFDDLDVFDQSGNEILSTNDSLNKMCCRLMSARIQNGSYSVVIP
eukprot:604713_1